MSRALWWSWGGRLFLMSEVPLYLHGAASGFSASLKRIVQLTFIRARANWPFYSDQSKLAARDILSERLPARDRPASGRTGPPRDGQTRLGTDWLASGRTDPPRNGQARLGTDGPPPQKRFLNLMGVLLLSCTIPVQSPSPLLQGYLAHKKLPPPQNHRRALGMVLL